ncbi:MAG: ABC transporter permease [Actinomycetota bacterium]|nr:ABC transporter permease [Actinomycetota bacterium]
MIRRSKGRSLETSSVSVRDLLWDGSITVLRRPGRLTLAAVGTVLGVGTVVATLGIVGTANQQVSARFNQLAATQVTVYATATGDLPSDSGYLARALPGVNAAGLFGVVDQQASVSTLPGSSQVFKTPVFAATAGAMAAIPATVETGRLIDSGMVRRADHVALLGTAAARNLNIGDLADGPAIFVNDVPYTVIGIVGGLEREPQALLGVIIPVTTALGSAGTALRNEQLLVSTRQGAAQVVGHEVADAVNPRQAKSLIVSIPPDPSTLRQKVEGTTSTLLLFLAGLALLVGLVAILNTTLFAVLERTPEIGLRRALGARRRHIAAGTLIEAFITGAIGGVAGTALGLLTTAGTATYEHWTLVLDPRVLMIAPLVGGLVGLLAGAYPAWRATRITPVQALQR